MMIPQAPIEEIPLPFDLLMRCQIMFPVFHDYLTSPEILVW